LKYLKEPRMLDWCENIVLHTLLRTPVQSNMALFLVMEMQGLFRGVVVAAEASSREGEVYNVVPADHVSISKPLSKVDRRYYALESLVSSVANNTEVKYLLHCI
jgi:hypothetical protein